MYVLIYIYKLLLHNYVKHANVQFLKHILHDMIN